MIKYYNVFSVDNNSYFTKDIVITILLYFTHFEPFFFKCFLDFFAENENIADQKLLLSTIFSRQEELEGSKTWGWKSPTPKSKELNNKRRQQSNTNHN